VQEQHGVRKWDADLGPGGPLAVIAVHPVSAQSVDRIAGDGEAGTGTADLLPVAGATGVSEQAAAIRSGGRQTSPRRSAARSPAGKYRRPIGKLRSPFSSYPDVPDSVCLLDTTHPH